MPVTVAQLMAVIGIDDAAVTTGAARARQTLGSLSGDFSRVAASVADVKQKAASMFSDADTDRVDKYRRTVRQLSQDIHSVATATMLAGGVLTAALTVPIIGIGTAAFDSAAKMDSLVRGLKAVTANASTVDKQLADLREVAKLPGLGFEEAVQGSIRLQAAGQSAHDAERELMAFGNSLAQVGKGKQELAIVIDELTRLSSESRVSGRSIMELSRQVPQLRQAMQRVFNTSDTMQLEKLGVDTKTFIAKLLPELEKIPRVTSGIRNSMENMSDSVQQSLAKLGVALLPIVEKILNTAAPVVENLTNTFTALPQPIQYIVIGLLALLAAIGPVTIAVGALGSALSTIGTAYSAASGAVALYNLGLKEEAVSSLNAAAAIEAEAAALQLAAAQRATAAAGAGMNANYARLMGGMSAEDEAAIASAGTQATAALTAETAAAGAATVATTEATASVSLLSVAMSAAIPVIGAFVTGYMIGSALLGPFNDLLLKDAKAADAMTEATRKQTEELYKQKPGLEEVVAAREKLYQLDRLIGASGHSEWKQSDRYKEALQALDDAQDKAKEAQRLMNEGFDAVAAKAHLDMQKSAEQFGKDLEGMKKELAELQAPNLAVKFHIEYPGANMAQIAEMIGLQKQVDAARELQKIKDDADKKAKSAAQNFDQELKNVREMLAELQSGTTLAKLRVKFPGVDEAKLKELAAMKDQAAQLEKNGRIHEQNEERVKALNERLAEVAKNIQGIGNATDVAASKSIANAHKALSSSAPSPASGHFNANVGSYGAADNSIPALPYVGGMSASFASIAIGAAGAKEALHGVSTEAVEAEKKSIDAREKLVSFVEGLASSVVSLRQRIAEAHAVTFEQKAAIQLLGHDAEAASPQVQALITKIAKLSEIAERSESLKKYREEINRLNADFQETQGNALPKLRLEFPGLNDNELKFLQEYRLEIKRTQDQAGAFNTFVGELQSKTAAAATSAMTDPFQRQLHEYLNGHKELEDLFNKDLYWADVITEAFADMFNAETVASYNNAVRKLTDSIATLSQSEAVQKGIGAAGGLEQWNELTEAEQKYLLGLVQQEESWKRTNDFVKRAGDAVTKFNEDQNRALKDLQADSITDPMQRAFQKFLNANDALMDAVDLDLIGFDEIEKSWKKAFNDAEARKAADTLKEFYRQMKEETDSANAKTIDPNSAVGAWASFLAGHKEIAKALQETTGEAGKAQQAFSDMWKSVQNRNASDTISKFNREMDEKISAARLKLSGAQPDRVSAAWQSYLASHDDIVKAIGSDADKAAAAFAKFQQEFQLTEQADAMEKLRKSYHDTQLELDATLGGSREYGKVLKELGVSADYLTAAHTELIRKIIQTRQVEEIMQNIADGMKNIFQTAFKDLFNHGFKSFFADVVGGFEQMLQEMAAKWLASQLTNLIMRGIGMVIGAASGGGGGGGGFQAGDSFGIASPDVVVSSGLQSAAMERQPSVIENHYHTYNIQTPDANSFRRTQTQLAQDATRAGRRADLRNR